MIELKEFDIIVLKGKYWNPLQLGIMVKSYSPYTHTLLCKSTPGDIYEAEIGGILNSNILKYKGRPGAVCRYRFALDDKKKTQNRLPG